MPLSAPTSPRAKKHTRAIQIDAYEREDGLWDLDAHISDVKTHPANLATGLLPPGAPIHDLWLRITVDRDMTVLEATAVSDSVPYPGSCDVIGPDYRKLVGLNLMQGFRKGVNLRMGGTNGCTHLTELAHILPSACVQAFAGDVLPTRHGLVIDDDPAKPFQLGNCHALRMDGPAVKQHYPAWAPLHRAKQTS